MKYYYLYKTYLFRRPAIYYILEKNLQLPRANVRIQKIHSFLTPSPLISTLNFIRAFKFEHIPEFCTHCENTVAAPHARLGNHYHPHPRCCQVPACSDENPHTPNDNDVTGCWGEKPSLCMYVVDDGKSSEYGFGVTVGDCCWIASTMAADKEVKHHMYQSRSNNRTFYTEPPPTLVLIFKVEQYIYDILAASSAKPHRLPWSSVCLSSSLEHLLEGQAI